MGWDIVLIVNEQRFVRRYSLIYTLIISAILLAPLSIYIKHKLDLQEIKTEVELKSIQSHIIKAMDAFGDHPDEVFVFPRFQRYASGLYRKSFTPVYTRIEEPLPSFMPGYHARGSNRYLISALPSGKYFESDYLVTRTPISFASVLLEASVIAFGIITLILLLSFYFLQSFSLPFKRVNEKLDAFIKESMHEINTPLSIINVNIDLFDSIHGKNRYFDRIKSATKSLATIYNDMDYLIKQNRVEYPDEEIDFNQFVHQRVEYFELVGQLKDIRLEFHAHTEATIRFNPTKLQRIVDNTLSNAVKFSPKHSQIEVRLQKEENGDVALIVRDFGEGIRHPEKILEGYYRENETKSGFGIGMKIVKSILEETGVQLQIDSTPGEGTTFTYRFPPQCVVSATKRL